MEITRRDFIASGVALAAGAAMAQEKRPSGLEVHEWGVVTVAQDATWGSIRSAGATFDAQKAEMASCPPEFAQTWTQVVGRAIEEWKQTPAVIYKPVIYFHSGAKLKLTLTVKVPAGRPAVWWPPASAVAPMPELPSQSGKFGVKAATPPAIDSIKPENGFLTWKELIVDPQADPSCFRRVPKDHWWHAARQTDSASVIMGNESDRFVFYDALSPVASALAIDWKGKDSLEIRNRGKHAIAWLLAIRLRDKKAVLAVHRGLKAGAVVRLELGEADRSELAKGLAEEGLSEKEIAGMVEIWRQEFFEAEGCRVLYSMPRPEIDALLPLEIDPKPDKLIRVLLAHVECLGPEGTREAEELIDSLGSPDIEVRTQASHRLQKLGPRVEGLLRRAAGQSSDAEIRARALSLLEALGVKP